VHYVVQDAVIDLTDEVITDPGHQTTSSGPKRRSWFSRFFTCAP
jgi:hypothetical protein